MEPCTEGKVGAQCWLLLVRVALFVLRKSPSTKRGGCVRNQGPTYPCVWLKHTPLRSRGENRVPLQPIVASQCSYSGLLFKVWRKQRYCLMRRDAAKQERWKPSHGALSHRNAFASNCLASLRLPAEDLRQLTGVFRGAVSQEFIKWRRPALRALSEQRSLAAPGSARPRGARRRSPRCCGPS